MVKKKKSAFVAVKKIYPTFILAENLTKQKITYNQIYNGNLNTKLEIFRRIEINLEIRNQMKEDMIPCDLRDPLNFNQFGFGFG